MALLGAQSRDLGGIMVWALGYDDMDSEESLTDAINTYWLNTENDINNIIPNQIELQTYPNPFNPMKKIKISLPTHFLSVKVLKLDY